MTEEIYICAKCNSRNIRQITWVDFNSREDLFHDDSGNVIICGECDDECNIFDDCDDDDDECDIKNERETMTKEIYVCAVCNSDKIRQLSRVNYNSRKELYPLVDTDGVGTNVRFQKDLNANNEYESVMRIVCDNCDDDVDKDIVKLKLSV